MPVMATIGLFYAVYHWNEWFYASIYITDNELKPMQIILRGLLNQATMEGMENISFMEQPPPGASLRAALIILYSSNFSRLSIYTKIFCKRNYDWFKG